VYGISEHNFTVQNLESKEPLVQCRVSVRTFVALQLSGQTENCDCLNASSILGTVMGTTISPHLGIRYCRATIIDQNTQQIMVVQV